MNDHLTKLQKTGTLFLLVLSVYVIVLGINALKENRFIGGSVPATNTITVSGTAEVFAVPDTAEFSFSVIEIRSTVPEAQDAAAEKVNAILAYIDDEGVEKKDIKTESFSVNPRYEYRTEQIVCITYPCPQPGGRQVLTGYEVAQRVSVKVRDTDVAGELLTGVGERGASNIGGLQFVIDDEDALKRDARKEAIADAQAKAKQLARDLGVRLVRVVSFYENEPFPPYYGKAAGFGGDGDYAFETQIAVPEIPTGENQLTSTVSITYEIR